MSWKDRTYKRTSEAASFPFIQWINDGGALEPRNEIGGFAMPLDQAAVLGANIPGDVRAIHHRNGNSTEVVFSTALQVAVLETRFCWTKNKHVVPAYETGARGKLQALALVRDVGGHTVGPVMLTFKGLTSKQFGAALREQRELVRKATVGKAPTYAFFGTYQAGEVKMVGNGQKSAITTVTLAANGFDPDAAFVSDAALDTLDWDQIDAWKAVWELPGGADSNRSPLASGKVEHKTKSTAAKTSTDPDAKASDAQWSFIRKLMKEIGIGEDEAVQNAAIRKQTGFDPAKLTVSQASDLIERLQKA
ncbi:MAG: hypothetical protein GY832_13215, partial [Chloroflexi bacterium]|nr:hypothetical protein [Chloroflexota bacterium]